ncbi:MAG TPA: alpha/beta fold hydrolase [Caulobacteraceae bacterium]|nr:alpha/beta fold hydrolase [Caulobacteraceae bacterium]
MNRRTVLLSALSLTACAPDLQHALSPAPGFTGPRLDPDAFVSFDGARLGLSQWVPDGEPWAVIAGLHGMDDYANAFHLAGPAWAEQGIATYAYDQRGFGRSAPRGIWPGTELLCEDLRAFCAALRARHPKAVLAIVGESMGGAVAIAALASARPPNADRVVLLAPAVWGWSSQPLAYQVALRFAELVAPHKVFNPPSFVTSHIVASDNTPELIAMGRDPLMLFGARTDTLYGLVDLMQTAWANTGKIRMPAAYLCGAKDQIIPRRPSLQAAARLPTGDPTAFYADGYHLLLRDNQRAKVFADIASFVRDPAAPWPSGAPPMPKPS